MTDTQTERYYTHSALIQRVTNRTRQLTRLAPAERQKALHALLAAQQGRVKAFCERFPDLC